MTLRQLGAALLGIPLFAGLAGAQILPPIYKPLPVEAGARHMELGDSLRVASQTAQARADALVESARTLRQNGTGVADRLRDEIRKLDEQASRLESQASVDLQTAGALRGQVSEFERRAVTLEARLAERRFDLERQLAEWDGVTETPPGILDLQAELRADSQTAVAFVEQARDLSTRASNLESGAAASRQRAEELRQQQSQLQLAAQELASGRGVNEQTAARLNAESRVIRQSADRLAREAREQVALADAYRVQADRLVLPARDREEAMRFFGEDGRSMLRNLVFTLGETRGAGSINSELVSDYAGPVRIGVGFVLAESRENGDEEPDAQVTEADRRAALERFYAGGGNFVIYSMVPLIFHRSGYHSLTVQTLNKIAADMPGQRHAGSAASVPANLDLGVEAYGTFNTFDARIKAFGLVRSGWALGNDTFYQTIGRGDGGAFPYTQITFGTEIASVAKVLLSGSTAPEGLGRDLSLTFQVAPNRR